MGKNSETSEDDHGQEHAREPLPDGPLDRAALYVKRDRDHPPGPAETAGLARYRTGIILLASLLLVAISLSTIHNSLTNARHRPSLIVVRSPEGDYETFPEGASLGTALTRWGVDTTNIDENTLKAPLPTGCRVVITGGPEPAIALESLDAHDLFILGVPFNINTASADEISLIPGIGEVLAGRIVGRRKEHGPFENSTDLMAVPGIGAKKSEKIMEYIIFHDILDGPEEAQ